MNPAHITAWMRDQFELSRDAKANIRSMEGLRGFAVLLVFFAHYVTQVEPWISTGSITWMIGDHLRSLGHAGVDLFFVLSGYLIYGALIRRHRPIVDFLGKRAARIYPTFLVVFGLYLVLSQVFPQESKLPTEAGSALAYIAQNLLFLPGLVSIEPLIVVSWSLSYEFFYYLAMPVFIAALSLRQWTPARRLALFTAISIAGFTYYHFHSGHVRLLMFVSGILLYEIQSQKLLRTRRWSGAAALAIAIVALAAIKHVQLPGWFRYTTLFVCTAWLCLECFTVKGGTERLFTLTPLRWLGNISYSYYLIHGLTLKAFVLAFSKVHAPTGTEDILFWALLPVAFGATVLVSAALFVCVEKPLSLTTTKPVKAPVAAPLPFFTRVGQQFGLPVLQLSYARSHRAWNAQRAVSVLKWLRQVAAMLIPLGMGFSTYVVLIM